MNWREKTLLGLVIILLAALIGVMVMWRNSLAGIVVKQTDAQQEHVGGNSVKSDDATTNEPEWNKVYLYNDPEFGSMYIEGFSDAYSGVVYMTVYVTNKRSNRIKFWFQDSYVNDEAVMLDSGYEVAPGKSGRFNCTIPLRLLSAQSLSDIKTIETYVSIDDVIPNERGDVDYDRVGDTPTLLITIKDHNISVARVEQ